MAGQSFSVQVEVSGFPPPQIQWERSTDGGKTWPSVMGATAPRWTDDCPSSDQLYRAIIFNSSGSAMSNAVTVKVVNG